MYCNVVNTLTDKDAAVGTDEPIEQAHERF